MQKIFSILSILVSLTMALDIRADTLSEPTKVVTSQDLKIFALNPTLLGANLHAPNAVPLALTIAVGTSVSVLSLQAEAIRREIIRMEQELHSLGKSPCEIAEGSADLDKIRSRFYSLLDQAVLISLNSNAPDKLTYLHKTLDNIRQIIQEPEERFDYKVTMLSLPDSPLFLLSTRYHYKPSFRLYGIKSGTYQKLTDLDQTLRSYPQIDRQKLLGWFGSFGLFPIKPAPNGRPRFLMKVRTSGCAGLIYGLDYFVWAWNGRKLVLELKRTDLVQNFEDPPGDLPERGELRIEGDRLKLPYCQWSEVDYWDHAELCYMETYDIRTERIRLVQRVVNRPDLELIAQAMALAKKRDLKALRPLAINNKVARRLAKEMPQDTYSIGWEVKKVSDREEIITFHNTNELVFRLLKFRSRWRISDFQLSEAQ